MAKEKALSTQLKEARAEIEKLKDELKGEKSFHESTRNKKETAEKEIESIHAALDCIPFSPPRKVKPEDYYNSINISASSRLFAWISNVAFGGPEKIKITTEGAKFE